MPGPGATFVDETPLHGSRIDLGVRIGWLLRSWRRARGASLNDVAAAVSADGMRVSVASLSRMETQGQRTGALIDGYERALGLPAASLRAPIDAVCRTFDYAPVDTNPLGRTPDLDSFSAAVDAVRGTAPETAPGADAGAAPSGGDWLLFARLHAEPVGFGLDRAAVRPLVRRLVSELSRSVTSTAYLGRYEALAQLRCSAYAGVVEDVIRDFVESGSPTVGDVFSALAERPTTTALAWCGRLLVEGPPPAARGAALAVENMRSVGGLPETAWAAFVPDFLAAYETAYDAGDDALRATLTRLFKTLSPQVRHGIKAGMVHDLVALPGPQEWSRSRRNVHYAYAERLADVVARRHRVGEQAMLARLLFELLFDFRATRSTTASFLLNASPYSAAVVTELVGAAVDEPDDVTRDGARGALLGLEAPQDTTRVACWPDSDDEELARVGHVLLGHGGALVAPDTLRAAAGRGGPFSRSVVYAAGMAGHPDLSLLRDDPRLPEEIRGAAGWFLREGSRVTR